jgi:hypothetical protein
LTRVQDKKVKDVAFLGKKSVFFQGEARCQLLIGWSQAGWLATLGSKCLHHQKLAVGNRRLNACPATPAINFFVLHPSIEGPGFHSW